ncbi:MAG: ferredoxin [Lachnospiraceae bacterium]|nr:ferredoxin [Lachnospiraceae bacterium]
MKTYVDQDTCISCGMCVSSCSTVYEFNDDGKAEAQVDVVPEELEEDARQAAEECPTSAIEITD